MNVFTQTLALNCTTPKGPAIAVAEKPRRQNNTTIPRQKIPAWINPSFRDPESRFKKYDIVIGIIGNTQGVKIDASPNPRAVNRNGSKS